MILAKWYPFLAFDLQNSDSKLAFFSATEFVVICYSSHRKLQHIDPLAFVWGLLGGLVVVQLLSHVWLFSTQGIIACQVPLSSTISQSWLRFSSIESLMLSSHLILCHPLLLLPSIFPGIRIFSNESALLIRWPEYWRFSFSIGHSNEYSGLVSSRTDWLELLAVQGTLKSLLQHHSSKASILRHSAFFIVQLSKL